MAIPPPGLRHRNRVEWTFTAALATLPISITLDPYTIEASSFRHLIDWGITPAVLAPVAIATVILRAVCLWYNGLMLPWTAYGRILGAFVTGLLWMEMSLALLELHVSANRPLSVGFGFWLVFAASELWTIFQAAADAYQRH